MDLLLLNDGLVPAFVRRDQASFLDLTMASQPIFRSITDWRVRVNEKTLSDHRYITFDVVANSDSQRKLQKAKRWQARHLDVSVLKRVFHEECEGKKGKNFTEDSMDYILTKACRLASRRPKPNTPTRRMQGPKYWWTEEIAKTRRRCIHLRRRYTRLRSWQARWNLIRQEEQEAIADDLWKLYRISATTLHNLIKRTKSAKWEELIDSVSMDP
ncbi:hypothetical protein BIW11_10913 [Tropilaelaps mercedesae]|uniref:Endonuclease/exonuclease/phosphatase domain-containing protein n=1 Tax=Tropilaelaps mercedesae TaxID=418985 RepID=A0A1V9XDE9_9ACAR|nr:hypothetical protein BIW11_10913 [Tropilaelaps mercedesae]